MKRCNSSRKGFTLLELILVVVILTIITSLILPNFKNTITKLKHKETSDQLVYMMRYAQSRAVTQNKVVRISFDQDFMSYCLEEGNETGPLRVKTNEFTKIKGRFGRTVKIPPGFQIQADVNHVSFFSDGTIDKEEIKVCPLIDNLKCFVVSTQLQRGKISTFKIKGGA